MSRSHRLQRYIAALLLATASQARVHAVGLPAAVDSQDVVSWLVVVILLAVLFMYFSSRMFYRRERNIRADIRQKNAQMALILNYDKTQVWTYDIPRNLFSMLSDDGQVKAEYTPIDFGQTFYDITEFTQLRERVLFPVRDGVSESGCMVIHGRKKNGETISRIYETHISVLHHDSNKSPRILIGIQRDITDDKLHREGANMLALRYHTVFNNSQVDMICYDANGVMTDINDKACSTFMVKDRQQLLDSKPNIKDIPSMTGIDFKTMEQIHTSSITDISNIDSLSTIDFKTWGRDKIYYEHTVSPIRSEDGQLNGIVLTGRNISEMVDTQHYQQRIAKQLARATDDIQEYIGNINYTLRISGMRIVIYRPTTHVLEASDDLSKKQLRLSQVQCVSLVAEADRRRVRGLFLRMDKRKQPAFTETLQMRLHDKKRRDIYLTFSLVPFSDKNGNITHYFGMCRNDSEMVYTDQRLQLETQKAQATEELKNTFLTNMSYEIRTPLNAILGFADLFNTPHDEADEEVFSQEIKRNTNELLLLVNDILYISKLDARMVEFKYAECDFALLFDGMCYMGWGDLKGDVQLSVDNPYSRLVVNIDEHNLGIVIEKLCTNAARHTDKGFIRAKYDYRHGELTITVEDSGEGVSPELLQHVFDRFPPYELRERYTTVLDMPIIKETVEQMGGTIEIQTEAGKGSTAYVIIPCEMTSMEKKTENV